MADLVSINDLLFAEDWLKNGYEGDPDEDENVNSGRRVAAWIRAEIERREDERAARVLAAQTGATLTRARRALREVRANRTAQED